MKRHFSTLLLTIVAISIAVASASAQKQLDPKGLHDTVLEADAKHNLEVANQYFKLKKAYVGSLKRCEEIIAAYPGFTRLDEVLYIAGMSSYYLSTGKGKQKPVLKTDEEKKKFEPAKLREDALMYLNQLSENYPQSPFLEDAKKTIQEIEPVK
jgi:outer membrane protein assembly factor BamD (BamD/ComL family)